MPPKPSEKRYQNISTVRTQVLKDDKPVEMPPGKIVKLRDKDVQDTRDSHRSPDSSPFDMGLIKQIPEGFGAHPEMEPLGRNPSARQAIKVFEHENLDAAEKLIASVYDTTGIRRMYLACQEVSETVSKSHLLDIEQAIERRAHELSLRNKELKTHYNKVFSGKE